MAGPFSFGGSPTLFAAAPPPPSGPPPDDLNRLAEELLKSFGLKKEEIPKALFNQQGELTGGTPEVQKLIAEQVEMARRNAAGVLQGQLAAQEETRALLRQLAQARSAPATPATAAEIARLEADVRAAFALEEAEADALRRALLESNQRIREIIPNPNQRNRFITFAPVALVLFGIEQSIEGFVESSQLQTLSDNERRLGELSRLAFARLLIKEAVNSSNTRPQNNPVWTDP